MSIGEISSKTQIDQESLAPERSYGGYFKYDETVARSYERDREGEAHWQRENDFIARHLASRDIGRLLDIPVGTGRFFPYYGRVGRVVGVDISEQMLNEARAKLSLLRNETIQLERGDVFHLRFADSQFDVTVVWRLLHLLPRNLLRPAISELCRVTNEELIVQTYTRIGLLTKIGEWMTKPLLRLFRKKDHDQFSTCPSRSSPWSHIRAYYHKQSLISSVFRENGFVQKQSKRLDRYGNCWVRANVYVRSAAKD